MKRLLAVAAAALAPAAVGLIQASDASANHYHNICVNHGFVHGSSTTDNAFHSRVEAGCGNPGRKLCRLVFFEGPSDLEEVVPAGVNATCNIFNSGRGGEYGSAAVTDFNGVFGQHSHNAH